MAKISESGVIGRDGILRIPRDRLNVFCGSNKGKRVIFQLETLEPDATTPQLAYYYNYIVPTIRQSFKEQGNLVTAEAVDNFLVSEFPGLQDGCAAQYGRELKKDQMSEFLDWLKQYAAENFNVYIEDSETL